MTNTLYKNFILVANEDEANQIGSFKNSQVIIIGEGRSKVISTLSKLLKKGNFKSGDKIINVGYVGGNGYKKGEVVKIGKVRHLFSSKTINEPILNLQTINPDDKIANCCTADNFVNKNDIDINSPCVVDMELYYIALMLPETMSIKIVSDELNYSEYTNANFKESWQKVRNLISSYV